MWLLPCNPIKENNKNLSLISTRCPGVHLGKPVQKKTIVFIHVSVYICLVYIIFHACHWVLSNISIFY